MNQLNLCKELLLTMEKMGFSVEHVNKLKDDKRFYDCYDKNPSIQRTVLTMIFYDLIMYTGKTIPVEIRISMNAAKEPSVWLEDITTSVLPFILVNAEDFLA